ncbi:hypothetical protein SCA6_009193 [Theobroma cacao]
MITLQECNDFQTFILFKNTNIVKIEDVFTRYIDLPDQEREQYALKQFYAITNYSASALIFPDQIRHPDIQNKEYLLRILQQLRSENDIALQLANPASFSSDFEGIQEEIVRLQQQLQMAEEQLRAYEPDLLRLTSMGELESCEKHLVDTLANIVQRKEYLLSNHLSSYHPSPIQQGLPPSFDNEVVNWLPDGGQNQSQIFDSSSSLNQLRDLSSTVYDPLLQGSISNPSGEDFQPWPQPFVSTPTLYSHLQHGMVGPEMTEMMANEQMEIPGNNSSHGQAAENGGSNYENRVRQLNGQ